MIFTNDIVLLDETKARLRQRLEIRGFIERGTSDNVVNLDKNVRQSMTTLNILGQSHKRIVILTKMWLIAGGGSNGERACYVTEVEGKIL